MLPVVYYRFENATSPGVDSMGHFDLQPTVASTLILPTPTPGGAVGSFAAFDGGNVSEVLAADTGAWNCSNLVLCDGITVEFLLRAGPNFNKAGETAVLSSRGQGSAFYFEALLARHGYGLHAGVTSYGFPDMVRGGEDVLTRLEGVGRASHSWLLDGGWHHLAFRKRVNPANASECYADIWIDGQSPAGFNSSGPARRFNSTYDACSFHTGEPRTLLPQALGGDLDEVAVWTTALSDTHIAAHAAGALRRGEPYAFTDPGGPPPPVDPTDGAFDLNEFAPGTQLPTPADSPNGTRGVTATCLQQLQAFPPPRYAATPAPRALPPLSNCMDSNYMAGENQPGVSKEAMINGSLAVQAELAAHWSYALIQGNVEKGGVAGAQHPKYPGEAEGLIRLLQLANAHPEWPFEASIIRANVYNISQPKGPHNKPAILSQDLPASCYLQDAHGTFIDLSGKPVVPGKYGLHKHKRLFTAAGGEAHGCPDSLFDSDGEWFRWTFASLVAQRNLTVPIIRLWEDGEILADVTETGSCRPSDSSPSQTPPSPRALLRCLLTSSLPPSRPRLRDGPGGGRRVPRHEPHQRERRPLPRTLGARLAQLRQPLARCQNRPGTTPAFRRAAHRARNDPTPFLQAHAPHRALPRRLHARPQHGTAARLRRLRRVRGRGIVATPEPCPSPSLSLSLSLSLSPPLSSSLPSSPSRHPFVSFPRAPPRTSAAGRSSAASCPTRSRGRPARGSR